MAKVRKVRRVTTPRHVVRSALRVLLDLPERLEQPVPGDLQDNQVSQARWVYRATRGQMATQGQQVFLVQRDPPELLDTPDRLEQPEQKEQPD